ncbi:MAG: tryptophan synthase subunit alpha, partial [Candidatus Subteraquimicrobiales bacterium]|nr:tryptophan synthase subunit alpha [Candidatus Subteraquimicrobiales bacterium]
MDRISRKFEELREKNQKALIPYIMGGYPSYESCKKIVEVMALTGADIIEIGIPFSDPLADGPTIQRASQIALAQNVTTQDIFNLVRDLRKTIDIPIILMAYYNLFYKYGLEKFANGALEAGVDGVIIPDLPPEEASDWLNIAENKLKTIFLIAPTSTDERIEKIASLSEGFIYCVSLTGVTGERR